MRSALLKSRNLSRLALPCYPKDFTPFRHLSSSKSGFQKLTVPSRKPQIRTFTNLIATVSGVVSAGFIIYTWAPGGEAFAETPAHPRKIRLSDVHKHGPDAERVWVIKDDRVYDITEWIPSHPGGEVILRAAGGKIDQYWKIFTIHQKKEVYDILEEYFIGVVDPQDLVDGQIPAESVQDPFTTDPERDSRLRVLTERPCNAETPTEELQDFLTPNEVFYVRNHLWTPLFKTEAEYKLTVEMSDGEETEYSMEDLRTKFRAHTITAVLQCSGNRRSHTNKESRPTQGLPWGVGGIGNAEWTGVKLRDVLKDAGLPVDDLPADVKHAQFHAAEAYGASIPIEKAVDKRGDVLLAYQMNGRDLPRDHGYPLRVIVPGHVAARSVKWVQRITASDEESSSQWQQRDYKCFGPNQASHDVDWSKAPAIQELPVQSAFTHIQDIKKDDKELLKVYGLNEDAVYLQGYAHSGGGRDIIRVDVSSDEGKTWRQAELIEDEQQGAKAWSWKRWRLAVPKTEVGRCFTVKAVDEAYQSQPESYESNWNFRGNLTTAWQRLPRETAQ